MSLDTIVNVSISATSPGATRQGFGIPCILGTPAWSPDRIRFYTDISGVAVDFAATKPEYLAALALFSQNPRPEKIAIARLANTPTQAWDMVPTVLNNTVYSVRIGASTVSYTSDGTATAAEITVGVKAAIDALGLALTVTTPGPNTSIHIVANTPGAWFDIEVLDITLLSMAQSGADPGVATDLDAILLADPSWYAIVNPWASSAMVAAVATWAEANKRLYIADSQDSAIATTVVSGATDIAATLNTAARVYTAVFYHPAPGSMLGASVEGRCLPLTPGSETWALKRLSGPVPTPKLTATQRANIINKKANCYELIAGIGVTNEGTVASGQYIDVTRLIDWTTAEIKGNVFDDLVGSDKIPYDDEGIAKIAGDVSAALSQGVANGGYTSYVVSVPKASSATTADKTARTLRNVNFTAPLAGAVHKAVVVGSVTV